MLFSTETSAPFLVNGKGQMTDPEWIQASSREGASRTMETCSETEAADCSAERPKRNDKENGPILLTFLQEKPDAHHRLKQRNHMKMKT